MRGREQLGQICRGENDAEGPGVEVAGNCVYFPFLLTILSRLYEGTQRVSLFLLNNPVRLIRDK